MLYVFCLCYSKEPLEHPPIFRCTVMECRALTAIQSGLLGEYAAEILFFLFKISEAMLEPSIRLFIYETVCLQDHDPSTCAKLNAHPEEEALVQTRAASLIMYYKMLINLPAILLVLFCGAWSDRCGRKLPVMLTCAGGVLAVLLYMMCAWLQYEGVREEYLLLILVGAAVRGAFGRSAVMTMSVHSYVSDISTKDVRTRKLAHLVAMSHFGYLIGCVICGSLLDTVGFIVVFCVVMGFIVACFLVAAACMRVTVDPVNPELSTEDDDDPKQKDACYSLGQLRDCFRVLTKPRPGHARCYLWLLMLCVVLQQTCKSGELDITMLFVKRAPMSWAKSTYSYLLGIDYACLGFMAFFVLPVLVKVFHFSDTTLILVGLVFKMTRTTMIAFSDVTWMVFAAVAIGGPHSFAISGKKSLISKLVHETELGKTFSLLSSLETVSNLMGTVMFTNLYSLTLPLWPGAAFIIESGVYLAIFLIVIGITCTYQNEESAILLPRGRSEKEKRQTQYGSISGSSSSSSNSFLSSPSSTEETPPNNVMSSETVKKKLFPKLPAAKPMLAERTFGATKV